MPDPTPQEQPKPTPKKEEGKSLFARLFKKKEAAIPEGARPIEMPKPTESPTSAPAPTLSTATPPAVKKEEENAKDKKDAPKEEPAKPLATDPIPGQKGPSKLFRSLELFKKDREERLGVPPAQLSSQTEEKKPSEPKVELPKIQVPPPTVPPVEAKKGSEPKKDEDKKVAVPPPLIPTTVKKVDPTVPSSIFISKAKPEPVKVEKISIPSIPANIPSKEDASGKSSPPEAKDEKKTDPSAKKTEGKVTIEKMEGGKPRQRRGRSIVDLPAMGQREDRSVGLFSRRIILIMGAILLSFALFAVWFLLRETRLAVNVQTDGVELSPKVYVVYDFADRVEMLRRNLAARRSPVRELLDDALASLNASQADYSGKAQRKKMLQENILKDQAEIPAMLDRTRGELDALWDKESKSLDREYAAARDEFSKSVEGRAKSLGLKYNPNPELNEPEVAVNAFRLSLYGAPKGIDVTAERKWAEDQLKGWREKEKGWAERRQKIRKEAEDLRAPVGGMIEEIKKRADFLQSQISEVDEELALIQNEINGFQDRVASYQKEMEDLIRPFYDELLRIPDDYKRISYDMTSPGRVEVFGMDKTKDMPPGRYKLLVRGAKDGQEYWALVNFEIKQYKSNQVEVKPSDFKPARKLIE